MAPPGTGHLLAVPNFSVGSDERVVEALSATVAGGAEVLDTHVDSRHGRTVISALGSYEGLSSCLPAAAAQAADLIDIHAGDGLHPCVGSTDVCPIVFPAESSKDEALGLAVAVGERIGEIGIPVFFYGELAREPERTERSYFHHGGIAKLTERMDSGDLVPDFGPASPHPRAGATLVTARPPLVAFNLELDTPDIEAARNVAGRLRESGGGLRGVRAIALPWRDERTQISINVGDPVAVPLAEVIALTRRLAREHAAEVIAAELVGLCPETALVGYPDDLPIAGFDPDRKVIERLLV